jgi:hypothetical protein
VHVQIIKKRRQIIPRLTFFITKSRFHEGGPNVSRCDRMSGPGHSRRFRHAPRCPLSGCLRTSVDPNRSTTCPLA